MTTETSDAFRDWLVRGEEGGVQRLRYEIAVERWNAGASEAEVAAILGLPAPTSVATEASGTDAYTNEVRDHTADLAGYEALVSSIETLLFGDECQRSRDEIEAALAALVARVKTAERERDMAAGVLAKNEVWIGRAIAAEERVRLLTKLVKSTADALDPALQMDADGTRPAPGSPGRAVIENVVGSLRAALAAPDRTELSRTVERLVASKHHASGELERMEERVKTEQDKALRLEETVRLLTEALEFYADPDTYFAIAYISDPPCGEFEDDFEDMGRCHGFKPGKRARAALAAAEAGDTPTERTSR